VRILLLLVGSWLSAVGGAHAEERREVGSPPPPSETGDGFSFGSYGRVGVGIDGNGHEGYATNVVSHGSRLEEAPYIELDLYYGGHLGDGRWRVVVAPAFGGDLFHYNGTFASRFALRNAYAEAVDFGVKGLRFWAGSRMYRGDDVYLFDYWPLDNLNTVGAGAGLSRGHWEAAVHGGLNLLNDPFQYQTIAVPARGLGPPGQAVTLDRPRGIVSLKLTRFFGPAGVQWGAKASLYGELHILPSGTEQFPTQMNRTQELPSDYGWVVGGQLGGWLRPYTFLNLFIKAAGGLAAYGDLTDPTSLDTNRKTTSARELVAALSANWESHYAGIMLGAYLRNFTDANAIPENPADYVEGIVATRPHLYLTNWFHVAVELSYQTRQYGGFDPLANRRLTPQVFRASLMPIISPTGRGTYSRPQIYLVGTVSRLNDDARIALFDPNDVRYGASTVMYLGVGAEWWFQSSYR